MVDLTSMGYGQLLLDLHSSSLFWYLSGLVNTSQSIQLIEAPKKNGKVHTMTIQNLSSLGLFGWTLPAIYFIKKLLESSSYLWVTWFGVLQLSSVQNPCDVPCLLKGILSIWANHQNNSQTEFFGCFGGIPPQPPPSGRYHLPCFNGFFKSPYNWVIVHPLSIP